MPERTTPQFPDVWEIASAVPGWLTEAQAELLWQTALACPGAPMVVEIGSHEGRSTIMLAAAAASSGGRVVAIDPFVEGRLFGGSKTRDSFEKNLAEAGLSESVDLLAEYSTRARPSWVRPIDYLYIDGKHDYWTLSDDLKWADHLPDGAPVLIHDCFSSIGVTLGILAHVLPSRRLTYERRVGSLALFRVTPPTMAARRRILAELPWWLRNVAVKVMLRLRMRRTAAAVFGHRDAFDPY
ncbi:hypothetical protein NSZ01_06300 [Nocardioides szechwanensis]|uniref:Methyltransferase domain-containing protein n=1 Tax=Nocardioides szechwanensis TaxID=1005944 RepID=A0A1G9VQC0_9ACTN|nr:class I SAM-dependent methyltransferase [Nocardioides szechwanensis]GEP32862.1 hypothetical protein NSZ01_06300 [Nocardioides szechwanensis]SDM74388.1 Methyltransferase domain-containing protein [Nocardioides szechwanensis]